jgi:hypothetical protein
MVLLFGAYLLVRAGLNGWGAYMLWDLDRTTSPTPNPHPIMEQLRDTRDVLALGLAIFGVLGAFSVASGIGLTRGSRWGRILWMGTSALIVGGIFVAVAADRASWTRYLFETLVVFSSWILMASQIGRRDA